MLNHSEGDELLLEGERCIRSTSGGDSHLVFGPYDRLEAGRYVAEYRLAKAFAGNVHPDRLCAILDVAADDGRRIIAHETIFASQLTEGLQVFGVPFQLTEPADRVEYRVRARADAAVVAADDVAVRAHEAAPAPVSLAPACALLRDTPLEIVALFKRGYEMRRAEGGFQILKDGVCIAAEERDDINFLGEIFEQRAYNLLVNADQCVIDVGMNVGLTSLLFASRSNVKEVHSFEPFPSTFAKAQKNLACNPELSAKIRTYNCGLSNRDAVETILVPDTNDSGSRATISVAGGRPLQLTLRDAATTLSPIIAAAKSRGRQVILKIDCEGSEFAIFESLANRNLFSEVDAFLVEWHAMFADKTVGDLTTPLLKAGLTVIDLSPPHGNGFFYAIRHSPRSPRKRWF